MLNAKQEMFVQNLVKGMSQREAYKKAYNATYDPKAIDSKACNLFNSDKIQARYKELMKEIKDQSIMTAIERRKWLTNVINGKELETVEITLPDGQKELVGSKEADLNTKMKAMKKLGMILTLVGGLWLMAACSSDNTPRCSGKSIERFDIRRCKSLYFQNDF